MNPLSRQAIAQSVIGLAFFIALIFLSAGTWHYWQGWTFLAVFAGSTSAFSIYLAIYDKPLLERRMKAGPFYEQERSQQIIVSLIIGAFFAFLVLPFSTTASAFRRAAVGLHLRRRDHHLSFLGIFWVIKANSWAASNIRVEADQRVVDTGPYAHVRHPMYAAAIWLFVGIRSRSAPGGPWSS